MDSVKKMVLLREKPYLKSLRPAFGTTSPIFGTKKQALRYWFTSVLIFFIFLPMFMAWKKTLDFPDANNLLDNKFKFYTPAF